MKTFEKWYSSPSKQDERPLTTETLKDSFIDCWNAATEAAKPRWIPVSEGLPDDWDEKLVKHGDKVIIASYQLSDGGTNGRKKGLWYLENNDYPVRVTHWMAVPEC